MNRRDFLLNAAGGVILFPLVKTLRGESNPPPRRLILYHTGGNGAPRNWMPSGSEFNFTLSNILSPLNTHKDSLLILKGLTHSSALNGGGIHMRTMGMLTGVSESGGAPGNISVDQFIAKSIGHQTRFKSINLIAIDNDHNERRGRPARKWAHALGKNQILIPEMDPQKAFDRILGNFSPLGNPVNNSSVEDPAAREVRTKRRSVLDVVIKELLFFQNRLSGSEREKIDAHLSSIRDIEKTLQDPDRNGFCEVTQQPPTTIDVYDNDTLHMRFKAHIDILVSALACDQTRVATLTAEGGAGMAQPKWIGLGAKHHDMSHGGAGWDRLYHWYAEQLAYLIQKLKAVPESNGTLFDNTAIAWVNEMGLGSHSMGDLPYLIAGSCGDQFRTGRFVDVSGAKEIGFLFNLLHAMGIYTNTMELASGNPIPNLLRG